MTQLLIITDEGVTSYRTFTTPSEAAEYTAWLDSKGRTWTLKSQCECGNDGQTVVEILNGQHLMCQSCEARHNTRTAKAQSKIQEQGAKAALRALGLQTQYSQKI